MGSSISSPPSPLPEAASAVDSEQEQQLDPLLPPAVRAATPPPCDETGSERVNEPSGLVWFCEPCLLGFRAHTKFKGHCKQHRLCPVPGCGFFASLGRHKAHVASEHASQKVAKPKPVDQDRDREIPPPAVAGSPCVSGTVAAQHNVWFCESCLLGFQEQDQFACHIGMHKGCLLPGCAFVGAKWIVKAHAKLVHPRDFAALSSTQQKDPTCNVSKTVRGAAIRADTGALCCDEAPDTSDEAVSSDGAGAEFADSETMVIRKALQYQYMLPSQKTPEYARLQDEDKESRSTPRSSDSVELSDWGDTVDADTRDKEDADTPAREDEEDSSQELVWFCESCLLGYRECALFDAHCAMHHLCSVPGCDFAALKGHVQAHVQRVHGPSPKEAAPQKQKQYQGPRPGEPSPCLSGSVATRYGISFCESCLLGFRELRLFEDHIVSHRQCIVAGCSLISIRRFIKAHAKLVHPVEYAALLPAQKKNPTRSVSHEAAHLAASGSSPASVATTGIQSMPSAQRVRHNDDSSQDSASDEESSSEDDSETEDVHETSSFSSSSDGSDSSGSENSDSDDDEGTDATLDNAEALSIALVARARGVDSDLDEAKAPAPSSSIARGKVWYCVACDEEIAGAIESKVHMSTHVRCLAPKCTFSASKAVMLEHFVKAHGQKSYSKREPQASQALGDAKLSASDAQVWQRGCTPPKQQTAAVPPDSYYCKICRTPGHWFVDCPVYIKFGSRPALLPPSFTAQAIPPTEAPLIPLPSAAEPNDETKSETKAAFEWRCDTCDKSFPDASQLKSHCADHVTCPEPDCGFSASKRLVTSHLEYAHSRVVAALVLPDTYVCRICQVSGHRLFNCPGYTKFVSPPALSPSPHTAQETVLPGRPHTAPVPNAGTEAAEPNDETKSETKAAFEWRCDTCDKSFPDASQLKSHCADHVTCPEPGCGFSASKRLVTSHLKDAHNGLGSVPQPRAVAASVLPAAYVCKICKIPGHWLHECPRILKSSAAQGDSTPQSQQKLPAKYCCKACGIPGHLIYNCSLKIKHYKAPSSAKNKKQWRCDVCEIDVELESQLTAHLKQHVSCTKLGCNFAASKRVVAKHAQERHAHDPSLTTKEPSDTSGSIVVQGRRYLPRVTVLDGVKCNVLVDVGEA